MTNVNTTLRNEKNFSPREKLKKDFQRSSFKLLISTAIVITIWGIIHNYFPNQISHENTDLLGIFYSIYGVLYAIIAAFLLVEVLTNYNALNSYMEEELNELQDIRDFVLLFDNNKNSVKKVLLELKDYVEDIRKEEWVAMREGTASTHHDTTKELYEIFQEIKKIDIQDSKAEDHIIGLLLGKMASLTSLRTKRISASCKRLPPRLDILLKFMSFILIAGTFFVPYGSEVISLGLVLALTISVHLLHMVIKDLNDPFDGVWRLDSSMLDDFINNLKLKID